MTNKRHLNILLVDDDLDAHDLLREALKRIGVTDRIFAAMGAADAIAFLKGEGEYADRTRFPYPSLLITDLKMELGDGFELLDCLKSTPEFRVIPTIVMSSSSDPDDIRKAYMLGASSYFVKPTRFEDLTDLLRLLYKTWLLAEVPVVDSTGRQLGTQAQGKLGEQYVDELQAPVPLSGSLIAAKEAPIAT